jgi:hypothetical protein
MMGGSGAACAMVQHMEPNVTAMERAFQLARSGSHASVESISQRLRREGYSVAQITGRTLRKQLQALIKIHLLR